jgi:serine protease Do
MTKSKKTAAMLALTAASAMAWVGGSALVKDVQFARAAGNVESTRQELQSVQDLSSVFRHVGNVVEPSVVQIQVRKTIKPVGGTAPDNGMLRKFFRDHGLNAPDNGNGDDNNNDNPAPAPEDGGGMEEVGTGSGVIMETDGDTAYILTNNHVAGGTIAEMEVTLADGRVIKGGTTVGADPKADLAVVKITADHLIPAKWGDSDQLSRGDWVLAFGSPFGYVGSMTHGIVSALNRDTRAANGIGILGSQGYENFIQVDAPINPGNSGGPLVNIHGEVVGINTAIASRSGAFSGIGFAIPTSEAKPIYEELKTKGHVTRGWLGVEILDVQRDPAEAKALGYDGDTGVVVKKVLTGTPSAGKLQAGDIITSIDNKKVQNVQELRNQVAFIAPGADAKIEVFRNDKETEVDLTMGKQPDDLDAIAEGGAEVPREHNLGEPLTVLGIHLSDVNDDMAQKFNLGDLKKGALITAVDPRSAAAMSGLQAGEVITRVGSKTVDDADSAVTELKKQNVKNGIKLYVTDADGSRFVFVQEQ